MLKEALKNQFEFTNYSVQKNLDGISHEDSLVGPEPGGNCMNWVLGHMIESRNIIFRLFGEEPVWGEESAELYGRHSTPIGPDTESLSFDELRSVWEKSQERLRTVLHGATDEDFARQVTKLFDPENTEPTGVQLAALAFHESYHSGQLGIIRRTVGKEPAIA